ncbi:MAG: hypothetical protein IKK00_07685 [Oscillospiraceae bacterium]|nr:hypothetical protein [Oscillospiraceae bacterium]
MKKIAAWLLAVLLLFTFAACGSAAEEPDVPESPSAAEDDVNSEETGANPESQEDADSEETGEEPENQDSADSDDQEGEEPETESVEKAKEFSLGTVSGQVWENEYLGLGCEFPDSWFFSSEQEIAELNGMTLEYIPEDFAEQMENADIVYDMLARSQAGMANVNVNFQKLTALQILTFDVRDTIEGTLGVVKEAYENMGYTNVSASLEEVQIDGKALDCMYLHADMGDSEIYVKAFMVLCDRHVANVTIAASSEAELQQIAECYYWL